MPTGERVYATPSYEGRGRGVVYSPRGRHHYNSLRRYMQPQYRYIYFLYAANLTRCMIKILCFLNRRYSAIGRVQTMHVEALNSLETPGSPAVSHEDNVQCKDLYTREAWMCAIQACPAAGSAVCITNHGLASQSSCTKALIWTILGLLGCKAYKITVFKYLYMYMY